MFFNVMNSMIRITMRGISNLRFSSSGYAKLYGLNKRIFKKEGIIS